MTQSRSPRQSSGYEGSRTPTLAKLSRLGKLERVAHRRQTACTPNADACRACGLCVVACPEKAITLFAR